MSYQILWYNQQNQFIKIDENNQVTAATPNSLNPTQIHDIARYAEEQFVDICNCIKTSNNSDFKKYLQEMVFDDLLQYVPVDDTKAKMRIEIYIEDHSYGSLYHTFSNAYAQRNRHTRTLLSNDFGREVCLLLAKFISTAFNLPTPNWQNY
ncbi:MAG: hypothetical protein ACI9TY_000020 [Alphaproteobacteria bacterium]|jgi:hypothetical protein